MEETLSLKFFSTHRVFLWVVVILFPLSVFSQKDKPLSDNVQNSTLKKQKKKIEKTELEPAITVTGTRRKTLLKDSVVYTEIIDSTDISSRGARTIAEALSNIPGVVVKPAESGQRGETIQLQGFSAQNVLILVDGQRTAGRFSGAIDLTRFKVEDIERIEIIKGASSALYGSDAIAGVINIITKEATSPLKADFSSLLATGSKKYYGEQLETRNTGSIGVKNENYSTQLTAGWHKGNGYDLTPDYTPGPKNGKDLSLRPDYDPYPQNMSYLGKAMIYKFNLPYTPPLESTSGNSFTDLNFSNKTIVPVTKDLTLGGNLFYRYLDQGGVDAVYPRTVFDKRNQTHDFMGAINADYSFTEKLRLNLNANYARFFDKFTYDQRKDDSLDKSEITDNKVSEFRSRLDFDISTQNTISFGAETLLENLSSTRIAPDCEKDFWKFCPNHITGTPYAKSNGYAERERNAVFVQDEWKFGKISLVPGIRAENDSIFGYQNLPKFALKYEVNQFIKIRSSAGTGYRAPSFQDMYFNFQNSSVGYKVIGNKDLKPEKSTSYNFGVELEPNKTFWISLNVFYNNISNLIGFRTLPETDSGFLLYKPSNYKMVTTKGAEASVQVRPHKFLTTSVGYTYTDARDEYTNLPLEGRGMHRGNLSFRFDHKPTGFGFSVFAIAFGNEPYYCNLSPYWCDSKVKSDENSVEQKSNFLASSLPKQITDYCTEKNIAFCAGGPVYGVRKTNAHTNLNFRIYKKIFSKLEMFLGVDNALNQFNLTYNPQRPRYYYFGVKGSFEADP